MDESWTIAELAELAQPPAAGDQQGHGPARASGRVRDVPNERLIRWYVTVGLVDPPLSRRGRVAWYGPRHLLQLVAIKRRQAEGRSLAEIQAELAGATNPSLAAVARVPEAVLATGTGAGVAQADRVAQAGRVAPAGRVARPSRSPGPSRCPGRSRCAGRALPGPVALARPTPRCPPPQPKRQAPRQGLPGQVAAPQPARPWPPTRPRRLPGSGHSGPKRPPQPRPGRAAAVLRQAQTARPDAGLGAAAGSHDWPQLARVVRLAPGVTLLLDGVARSPGRAIWPRSPQRRTRCFRYSPAPGCGPAVPSTPPPAAAPDRLPDDPDAPERSRS